MTFSKNICISLCRSRIFCINSFFYIRKSPLLIFYILVMENYQRTFKLIYILADNRLNSNFVIFKFFIVPYGNIKDLKLASKKIKSCSMADFCNICIVCFFAHIWLICKNIISLFVFAKDRRQNFFQEVVNSAPVIFENLSKVCHFDFSYKNSALAVVQEARNRSFANGKICT